MRIAFVIARVGEERNIIQKLSLILADELKQLGDVIDVFPFSRKSLLKLCPCKKLNGYDCILIANVGLQCAYFSFYKRLGLIKKPFVAISFGSDIRSTNNTLINFFNKLSRPVIDLLITINPDLVAIAQNRGYRKVRSVNSWAGVLA